MIFAPVTVVAAALLGWADITVQPSRADRAHSLFRAASQIDKPSERTLETIRRNDLSRHYRRDLDGTLQQLERIARAQPDADVVYALAELSWVEGKRLDRWRKAAAIDRFLDAVAYAYDYLFDPELASGREPSDPRFRLACDIYNGGLEHLIHAAQSNGRIEPEGTIKLKVHGKEQVLRVSLNDTPWTPDDVDQLIVSSDFEVAGLNTRTTYRYGLGVPLIAVRRTDQPGQGGDRFYPPEMAFPLTAFLRPNSRVRDPKVELTEPRECTLELIDPVRRRTVGAPAAIPVESDLTTPLAYMWSRTDLNRYRWTGLLRPGEAMSRANLMLIRPYEPGKIPVVMVHGLISSPLAWIPMLNDLLSDPTIQQRYQFFLYMYPTGMPIPIAMSGFRDSLLLAERSYSPQGRDPAFNQMVLLGHSMGGLLSHAMAVDSGDELWRLNTDRPFDEIVGPPETLAKLRHYLFFRPLPFVRRVVFLATPHRGSDMSRGVVGRVGAGLISEPDYINDLLYQLIKDNPDTFDRRQFRRMPTSVETLEPDSPILSALLGMKPGPQVGFHSIIGAVRPGPVSQSTDGVVAYKSSHLEGVQSERIVRSGHGVQRDPEAIREVQRILYEHVGVRMARRTEAAAAN